MERKSLIKSNLKGGGKFPPRDVILLRAEYYCKNKLKQSPHCMLPAERLVPVYCLTEFFAFNSLDIANFFMLSRSAAYKDIRDAYFAVPRMQEKKMQAIDMKGFIIYNAKWTS